MTARRPIVNRLVVASMALVAGVLTSLVGASPAKAIGIEDVTSFVGYAKAAYSAYEFLFGNELTLDQAEKQIKDAITGAQTEIVGEIDRVAVDSVRSCARTA